MLRRIKPGQVRLGMFIEVIEGTWPDQPFWRSRFLLDRQKDVETLKTSGVEALVINTDEGKDIDVVASPKRRKLSSAGKAKSKSALQTIEHSKTLINSMFQQARTGHAISVVNAKEAVDNIAECMSRDSRTLIELTRLKSRDEYTFLHSIGVTALMVHLGHSIQIDDEVSRNFGMGGLLHDVGKIKIPLEILNKAGPLDEGEILQVRKHPSDGYDLLFIQGDMPQVVLDICLNHHERIDGMGYPNGLSGEQITVPVRIASICDVYDALTSKRAYKKAWSPSDAAKFMSEQKGQFDQSLLRQFFYSLKI